MMYMPPAASMRSLNSSCPGDTAPPLERLASTHMVRPQSTTRKSENPFIGFLRLLPVAENFWSTPVRQWSRGKYLETSIRYIRSNLTTVSSRRSICYP
jgi:hypothetical protein